MSEPVDSKASAPAIGDDRPGPLEDDHATMFAGELHGEVLPRCPHGAEALLAGRGHFLNRCDFIDCWRVGPA